MPRCRRWACFSRIVGPFYFKEIDGFCNIERRSRSRGAGAQQAGRATLDRQPIAPWPGCRPDPGAGTELDGAPPTRGALHRALDVEEVDRPRRIEPSSRAPAAAADAAEHSVLLRVGPGRKHNPVSNSRTRSCWRDEIDAQRPTRPGSRLVRITDCSDDMGFVSRRGEHPGRADPAGAGRRSCRSPPPGSPGPPGAASAPLRRPVPGHRRRAPER
jgi:hypothetical protein